MRLYGYPIRLISYHRWLRQLEDETTPGAAAADTHPLRALRSFFLERPIGAGGMTQPELYEETRRCQAGDEQTRLADLSLSTTCPALDAGLLSTYFRAFIDTGTLPAPSPGEVSPASRPAGTFRLDAAFFSRALPGLRIVSAEMLPVASDTSIISELTAWRSRRPSGIFKVRLTLDEDSRLITRDVIVKAKPLDTEVTAVGEALANLCDSAIGREYAQWSDQLGLVESHTRELAIYAQTDPRFVRHAPALLGAIADPSTATWLLVLEHVGDASVIDSADRRDAWTADRLDLAVEGMAALQAIWYGREPQLRELPWIGSVPSADGMATAAGLWKALAAHASPRFSAWANPDIAAVQRRLIATISDWWPSLAQGPRTLVHNDFNPRNICIRGTGDSLRVCAYDWELATVGAPQHDLAELLCFALSPAVTSEEIEWWIERHRGALGRQVGSPIEPQAWREGFRAALYDLLINRLAMYALVHRVRPQAFLPRVLQTWYRLYQHYSTAGTQ